MDSIINTDGDKLGQDGDYDRESVPEEENVELAAAEADALRTAQLFMLGRMRGVAMDMANALNRKAQALALDRKFPGLGDTDPVLAFTRLSRSMLQMMAMEQEIMGLREKKRWATQQRRDWQRGEEAKRRRVEKEQSVRCEVKDLAVKALTTGQYPYAKRNHLAGLMNGVFKDVLKDEDFEGLSQREIVARICTELRIADPDLSIWPDDKPAEVGAADDDRAADDLRFPDAAATALAGCGASPAYANGHDPP